MGMNQFLKKGLEARRVRADPGFTGREGTTTRGFDDGEASGVPTGLSQPHLIQL
jgi:hypothetical protein